MLLFLLLLVAAAVVVGIFAGENGGNHDFVLFNQHIDGYSYWLPVVATAVVFGVLWLLTILYGRIRIAGLRRSVVALREENASLRSSLEHGGNAVAADEMAGRDVRGRPAGRFGFFGRQQRRRDGEAATAGAGATAGAEGVERRDRGAAPPVSGEAGAREAAGTAGPSTFRPAADERGPGGTGERAPGTPVEPATGPDLDERLRGYGTPEEAGRPATRHDAAAEGYGSEWPRRDEPTR